MGKRGATSALYWILKPGSCHGEHLVRFPQALPPMPQPTIAVLDNGSMHRNAVVTAAIPDLWRAGIFLYYLPPYSPQRNEIEPAFGVTKHHELPARRYASVPALIDAARPAFTTYQEHLIAKHQHQPRPTPWQNRQQRRAPIPGSASSSSPTALFRTPLASDSARGGEILEQVRSRRGTIALSHQVIDLVTKRGHRTPEATFSH